jgi:EmrB/QacA subfamily drug resistance transporter
MSAPSAVVAAAVSPARLALTLLGVMLAMRLSMLDNTIVGTAMPTIVRELGGLDLLSWVVVTHTLATAISAPVWGKLGDLRGRKNVFLASIVIFLIGSALSGAAQSIEQLIAFQALQGLGAGGLAVGALALIGDLVEPRERGRYQGMAAIVMVLGIIGGPLLGGFVTGHFGWRWAFYINIPIGIVTLVWSQIMLRLPAVRRSVRIDWLGVVLLALTTGSIVLAASWAGVRYDWISPQIIGLALAAIVGLTAFIRSQRRTPEPLLPPRIWSRNMVLASVLVAVAGGLMFGCSLYLPLFQQTVQGVTATESGLLLLPMLIPMMLASQIPGTYMTRTGRYKLFPIIGTILVTAGTLLLATMDASTSSTTTSLYLIVVGTGLGFFLQTTTTIAQNSVDLPDMGRRPRRSPCSAPSAARSRWLSSVPWPQGPWRAWAGRPVARPMLTPSPSELAGCSSRRRPWARLGWLRPSSSRRYPCGARPASEDGPRSGLR